MIIAGIVAGGTGSRMGNTDIPKQFFELGGEPVIIHTIKKFLLCGKVDYVIVGINPIWKDYMENLRGKYFPEKENIVITNGGKDRNETILNIISAAEKVLSAEDKDIILTHDAVRPFVTKKIILDNINIMEKYNVCTTAIPSTDTIICLDNNIITDFPLRSAMFQEQTPQTFRIGAFKKVYNSIFDAERNSITDACKLFYLCGYDIGIVEGDVSNIKLTFPFDYSIAEMLVKTEWQQYKK